MSPREAPRSVPALLRRLARQHGARELLVADARRLTYAEAEARSAALALGLLDAGVSKGSRVGALLPNGPEFVVSCLATTRPPQSSTSRPSASKRWMASAGQPRAIASRVSPSGIRAPGRGVAR